MPGVIQHIDISLNKVDDLNHTKKICRRFTDDSWTWLRHKENNWHRLKWKASEPDKVVYFRARWRLDRIIRRSHVKITQVLVSFNHQRVLLKLIGSLTWVHDTVNTRQLIVNIDDGVEPLDYLSLDGLQRGVEGDVVGAGVADHLDA